MSLLNVVFIILAFITIMVYIGNSYTKVNISKEVWLIITIVTGVLFILSYLFEIFKNRKKENIE